ncbi:fimbria/pilus outer membrane usher protein [Salmonella enterica]|uniref:fimbria/pilus outer membrane usher protein n=1 Tax=Salmonella enterica TaxID=28901 RepID=UPI00359C6132
MSASRYADGSGEFTAGISRCPPPSAKCRGLLLGKSQTRSALFSDFGFYGAALRSNSNMLPWEARGYARLSPGGELHLPRHHQPERVRRVLKSGAARSVPAG